MSKYVVESSHTPEECLQALDELAEKGEDALKQFAFGCKSGEHTGWAYVDADSKKEALDIVPEFIKNKARAHEVSMFTSDEIKAAHTEA